MTDVEAISGVLRERDLRLLYAVTKRGTAKSLVNSVHPRTPGRLVEPAMPA